MGGREPAHERATALAVGAGSVDALGEDVGAAGPLFAEATNGRGRAETPASILPAFDDHHPPSKDLIDDCVHCGFCLPTCPTYVLFGEEMDSPRGRIYLMKEGLEGEPLTDTMARHFDLCLGCLACVTACPSGVQYDRLIDATRQQLERRYPRPRREQLYREAIFALFPHPGRLRPLAVPLALMQRAGLDRTLRRSPLARRLPRRVRSLLELAPTVQPRESLPELTPTRGRPRASVGLLTGCVQRVFFSGVNAATVRVLAADGCEVVVPQGQGCCGALSGHAGREREAQAFARRTIETFEAAAVDVVAVNSAGCGSAMKSYGDLLRDDPEWAQRAEAFSERVRDVSELLVDLGPIAERHPLPVKAVYHDACHLSHGQGVRAQPRAALCAIPGLEVHEIREAELCCGSAGIYNLVEPATAAELGARKARNVLATGGQLLVTSNPGCLLQIRASLERLGESLPLAHPVEVLDASLRGAPVEELLATDT